MSLSIEFIFLLQNCSVVIAHSLIPKIVEKFSLKCIQCIHKDLWLKYKNQCIYKNSKKINKSSKYMCCQYINREKFVYIKICTSSYKL